MIVLVLLAFLATTGTWTTLYRLFFHPLSKFPGPLSHKLSGWPLAFSAIRGSVHTHLLRLHQAYGDVVRVAPNQLSYWTVDALHCIYDDPKSNAVKSGWTEASLEINRHAHTHNIADRDSHLPRRRLLAQAFSESSLRWAHELIFTRVLHWCSSISFPSSSNSEGRLASVHDVSASTTQLTLDILGSLVFGQNIWPMTDEDNPLPRWVLQSSKINHVTAYLPIRNLLYPILRRRNLFAFFKWQVFVDDAFLQKEVSRCLNVCVSRQAELGTSANEQQKANFFARLSQAELEGRLRLSSQDTAAEAVLIVAAGTDTLSTAMSATFFYLCRFPQVLRRLRQEIRGAFTTIEEIRDGQIAIALPYLRAVLKESLRLSPPIPGVLQRRVLQGGLKIGGSYIPEGTFIGVPAYAIHHNPAYFERPASFNPERWLQSAKSIANETLDPPPLALDSAFFAFSLGPRACLGKSLALHELSVMFSTVLFKFDISFADEPFCGNDNKSDGQGDFSFQIRDWFLAERSVLRIRFSMRDWDKQKI